MLQPGGRRELVQDDVIRELDQGDRYRRWVLAGNQNAHALMPHLSDRLDESCDEVGAVDVLVRLVEHDQLVEMLTAATCLGEQLHQHDEEAERLVLLDELVTKVDDDQTSRADEAGELGIVVDVVTGEVESLLGKLLDMVRHARVGHPCRMTSSLRSLRCARMIRVSWRM